MSRDQRSRVACPLLTPPSPQVLGKTEEETAKLAVKPKPASWSKFLAKFGWPLFGCASTWFLLDIAYYAQAGLYIYIYINVGNIFGCASTWFLLYILYMYYIIYI